MRERCLASGVRKILGLVAAAGVENGEVEIGGGISHGATRHSGSEGGGGVGRRIDSSGTSSLGWTGSARRISFGEFRGGGVGVTASARRTGLSVSGSTRSAFKTGLSVGVSTACAFKTGFVGSGSALGSAPGDSCGEGFSTGFGFTVEWTAL